MNYAIKEDHMPARATNNYIFFPIITSVDLATQYPVISILL